MNKAMGALFAVLLAASMFGSLSAREVAKPGLRPERPWSREEFPEAADPALNPLYSEAAVDTYCIVWYTFETFNWQGWTRVDNTAQVDTFFHVDDFAALGGGDFGRLVPLEGARSMWCGARPNPSDPYVCSWAETPGYGHGWNQLLTTNAMSFIGTVTLSYSIMFDSEPDYDYTYVEYDAGGGNWQQIDSYDDRGRTAAAHVIPLTTKSTKLRFRFQSDGAWDDQDGLWNTDGACIMDSIRVADSGGYVNFESFEGAPVGAKDAGIWHARTAPSYGMYSGLRYNLADKDPCGDNFETQVVFFVGSPFPSSSYPGLFNTPFCKGTGGTEAPCQNEMIVSPAIDMTKYSTARNEIQDGTIPAGELAGLGGCYLRFTLFEDNPLPNLVFHYWHVRNVRSGCPEDWLDRNYVGYPAGYGEYLYYTESVGDFINADKMQVALGVVDMCDVWYLMQGNCAAHTPAPWFDNVRVYRFKTSGPQWGYRGLDLFQDNFPVAGLPPWGAVRADAANDIRANDRAGIDPGDSIVVDCSSSMGGGIDTMLNGYPAVYLHVNAHWIGAGAPPPGLGAVIHGAQLQGTCGLWLSTDAGGWDIIQGDYARTKSGIVARKYAFDLNDSLFVPGYIIEYYFTATDNVNEERALPKWARSTGPYFEFTCLPTGKSDILFVDDFTGRGSWNGAVEDYWKPIFQAVLPPENQPDRYDVNGPSSGVSNGPGSRANAALMRYQYHTVVWDSGDLNSTTISDGTVNSDKSNDCELLVDWMSMAEHTCGLWVCGDDIAYDLTINCGLSTPALALMQTWCGVTLVSTSYFEVTGGRTGGGIVFPLVTGNPAGIFVHGGVPDSFRIYGGCFVLNQFDCLEKTANGQYALDYPPYGETNYHPGILAQNTNSASQTIRTMWFGFSMIYVRDDEETGWLDRFELACDCFKWFGYETRCIIGNPQITPAEVPIAYRLTQNFPNPFNPVTTIKYDMKEKGLLTVKIFNVSGQLVRTLVSEVKDAGSYTAVWDGRNSLGAETASGIYFYKMETTGFSATKKMVLLR